MTIYDTEGFPNPAPVRTALAEMGATGKVEFVPVDVMSGEHRTDAVKQKNPDAVVPCLELEDGTQISRCTAITEYIDGIFDGPPLTGTTPKNRAQICMMSLRAGSGLLNVVGYYVHHATEGLGPDLEIDQCVECRNEHKVVAAQILAYLDDVLAKNDYLAGDAFSVADILAFAGFAFADVAKVHIPANLQNLTAWRAKVAARPSIAG